MRTMRVTVRRAGLAALAVLVLGLITAFLWFGLNYEPQFYREADRLTKEERQAVAKQFESASLQLRNDIVNEPVWEAVFTDKEVNSWITEQLLTFFGDQLPPGMSDPRVSFEPGRITLGFQYQHGAIKAVIWVVARVEVPAENSLALTLEKVRAGVLPVPIQEVLDRITDHVRKQGVELTWEQDQGNPKAIVRYHPHMERKDVVLTQVELRAHELRLVGRSDVDKAEIASPRLPDRRVMQSAFPGAKSPAPSKADGSGRINDVPRNRRASVTLDPPSSSPAESPTSKSAGEDEIPPKQP